MLIALSGCALLWRDGESIRHGEATISVFRLPLSDETRFSVRATFRRGTIYLQPPGKGDARRVVLIAPTSSDQLVVIDRHDFTEPTLSDANLVTGERMDLAAATVVARVSVGNARGETMNRWRAQLCTRTDKIPGEVGRR